MYKMERRIEFGVISGLLRTKERSIFFGFNTEIQKSKVKVFPRQGIPQNNKSVSIIFETDSWSKKK
jgi:hypothetical protein